MTYIEWTLQFYYQLLKHVSCMTCCPYQILSYYNHLLRVSMAKREHVITTPTIDISLFISLFIVHTIYMQDCIKNRLYIFIVCHHCYVSFSMVINYVILNFIVSKIVLVISKNNQIQKK